MVALFFEISQQHLSNRCLKSFGTEPNPLADDHFVAIRSIHKPMQLGSRCCRLSLAHFSLRCFWCESLRTTMHVVMVVRPHVMQNVVSGHNNVNVTAWARVQPDDPPQCVRALLGQSSASVHLSLTCACYFVINCL